MNNNDVIEEYKNSCVKKWIKLISFDDVNIIEYNRKEYFTKVANISLDNELNKKNKIKKRKTLIQFIPTIDKQEFNEKNEWIYLITINNNIVKIGGTRIGLKGRISSYLCGHHIKERNKSGDCSKTNGFIYNTLHFYLTLGYEIEMYAYKLPKKEITIDIFIWE